MIGRRTLWAAALAPALALAAGLAGCTTNPATGGSAFTAGQTTEEEVAAGRKLHPQVLKVHGGSYSSEDLQRYVDSIGQLLARTTEREGIAYTFTVINSQDVNAFAIPGGYIYVSRGLLALAGDEAELAAVLAHELGHITALHHARGQGRALLANIGLLAAGVLAGATLPGSAASNLMRAGQVAVPGVLSSFSREDELEADTLGIRYLARAGYDPAAMARFLARLRAHSRLEAEIAGLPPETVDQTGYLATHPAPVERVVRAEAGAREVSVVRPIVARDIYYGKIDGIVYGDDAENGFVRGRSFIHPKLRFAFTVPEGFRLRNGLTAVTASDAGGARIRFDMGGRRGVTSPSAYLTRVWARGTVLYQLEDIEVNGMPAATGTTRVDTGRGWADVRAVALMAAPGQFYRFLFLTPVTRTRELAPTLKRTTYSLRRIDAAEAAAVKPRRLSIVRAGAGDTEDSLARRMAVETRPLEWLRVLNGLAPGERPRPGEPVKIVVE